MIDIIAIVGLIIGVIIFIIGKKKQNNKVLIVIGVLLIFISIVIAAPEFVRGFSHGFMSSRNS